MCIHSYVNDTNLINITIRLALTVTFSCWSSWYHTELKYTFYKKQNYEKTFKNSNRMSPLHFEGNQYDQNLFTPSALSISIFLRGHPQNISDGFLLVAFHDRAKFEEDFTFYEKILNKKQALFLIW